MKKQTILSAHKDSDERVIIHVVPEPGKDNKIIKYAAVIGGISWPTEYSPLYFCVMGKLWNEESRRSNQEEKKGNLVFLDEHESNSLSLDEGINKLTDSAKRFYCDRFYTNIGEAFAGYIESFQGYVTRNKIKDPRPSLQEAPYNDDFLFGVKLVKDWEREKRIEIPEDSIAYKQLKPITMEHLKDKPEVNFYAVNALRFVMGAFFKFTFGPGLPPRRKMPGESFMTA